MSAGEEVVEEFIPVEDLNEIIPSKELCNSILRSVKASTASVAHADMVERVASHVARCIARRYPGKVNLELVTAGAMLHEMGTSRERGLRYIMAGVGMARKLGLDPRLIEVIRRHKGMAIGPVDAGRIGIPMADLSVRTVEQWVVGHVDMLVVGDQRRSVQETAETFVRAGQREAAERILDSHIRLSLAAGCDVDKLGPTGEMSCMYQEDPSQGLTKRPGKLLAVEDEASVERKRKHRRTEGRGWMMASAIPLLLLLLVSTARGFNDGLWAIVVMLGPVWLIVGLSKVQGPSNGMSGPAKVYENGVAMRAPDGDYTFLPWGVRDVYYVSEREGLGKVLTVPLGLYSVEFLASMRDFDVVERVVKRKRVPDSKLSVWGPGPSPSS